MMAFCMTSRHAELIGFGMSACNVARPSASRRARFSSSLCPHELQNRARKWFLQPHDGQRSLSLRLGMATNDPLVPSMILRSRTTNALSKVTEQNACSRSLFSATSLMRTSVMTTAVLLKSVAASWPRRPVGCSFGPIAGPKAVCESNQAANDEGPHPCGRCVSRDYCCDPPGVAKIASQGEYRRAAAGHQISRRLGRGQLAEPGRQLRSQLLGRRLQAVVQL